MRTSLSVDINRMPSISVIVGDWKMRYPLIIGITGPLLARTRKQVFARLRHRGDTDLPRAVCGTADLKLRHHDHPGAASPINERNRIGCCRVLG